MVQGNGERTAAIRPCPLTKSRKRRFDQWFTMPGRVAEVAQVRAAGHVQRAPERLARHGDEHVPAFATRDHLGERSPRVGHVLQHLERAGDVELVRRQTGGLGRPARGTRDSAARAFPTPLAASGRPGRPPPRDLLRAARRSAPSRPPRRTRRRAPTAGAPAPTARRARRGSRSSAAGRPGSSSRTCRRCCRWVPPRRPGRSQPSVPRAPGPARSGRARRPAGARCGARARGSAAGSRGCRRARRRGSRAPRAGPRR